MTSAIILAAGMGTRLGSYTAELPKGMLSFLGQTLIERQVKTLRNSGIQDITIVRGYHPEKISLEGVTYFENRDYRTTNMVATLMTAREKLLSEPDAVLVCYSDIVYEERLIDTLLGSRADVSVLVDDDWLEYWKARLANWASDIESLKYDDSDNLLSLGVTNCPVTDCQSRYIGLIKLSQSGVRDLVRSFDELKEQYWDRSTPWRNSKSFKTAYMTCMLQELIDRKVDVKVAHTRHGWLEFDTVEDYEKALEWARTGSIKRFIQL